jgi:hypothetical protein|tara:strand:- start:3378 stop:3794 length:417 start_codon:yes stop_codon:yes gene_type:complete
MKIQSNGNTFNDKMVKKTVLPAIYLWLLACAAVVGMGIWKPDVVLQNLDGFIALIAIIGGVAAPALQTVLRMWESEQVQEVDNIPIQLKHQREMEETLQNHQMEIERLAQSHKHSLETSDQSHSQLMDKVPIKKGKGE